jgi:hypothetical protein
LDLAQARAGARVVTQTALALAQEHARKLARLKALKPKMPPGRAWIIRREDNDVCALFEAQGNDFEIIAAGEGVYDVWTRGERIKPLAMDLDEDGVVAWVRAYFKRDRT